MESNKKTKKGGCIIPILIAVTILAVIGAFIPDGDEPAQSANSLNQNTIDYEDTLEGKITNVGTTLYYNVGAEINGFTILNVKKYDQLAVGNTDLENVIVLETDGVRSSVESFLSESAFVQTCDKEGKIKSDYASGIWADSDKTFCAFYSETSVSDQIYIDINGFNADKNNGTSSFIFKIS